MGHPRARQKHPSFSIHLFCPKPASPLLSLPPFPFFLFYFPPQDLRLWGTQGSHGMRMAPGLRTTHPSLDPPQVTESSSGSFLLEIPKSRAISIASLGDFFFFFASLGTTPRNTGGYSCSVLRGGSRLCLGTIWLWKLNQKHAKLSL